MAGGAAVSVFVLGLLAIVLSIPKSSGATLARGAGALRVASFAIPKRAVVAPAAATEILIKVVSKPEGATLSIDGKERGPTPIEVTLPKSDAPVELTLKLEGYDDAIDKITPDENQRFRVSLTKTKKVKTGGGTAAKPPPAGFHRFD